MADFKDDVSGLKTKLEQVEQDFHVKLKIVEKKEEAFKELDLKLQDIMTNDANKTIKLNVGGKTFTTKLSTILSVKDTVFYRLIGDYVSKGKNIPDTLFFDRSYQYFELVLNYLRFKLFSLKKYTKFEKEDIKDEVEYYGLSECLSLNKKNEIEI